MRRQSMTLRKNRLRLPLIGLVIATICVSGCSTVVFEQNDLCPPAVVYDQPFLNRAAEELDFLPPGSASEDMLSDDSVWRRQVVAGRGEEARAPNGAAGRVVRSKTPGSGPE